MRKTKKIILLLIITFLLVNIFNEVFAMINPDDYDPGNVSQTDTEIIFTKTSRILGAIRNISIVTSVISLMIIGLKYMLGSVEEKANYKQTMLPYVIGCIMAVTGTTIVSFIYDAVH